jgi:hypothetical protein
MRAEGERCFNPGPGFCDDSGGGNPLSITLFEKSWVWRKGSVPPMAPTDRSRKGSAPVSRRKLIEFDAETWHALQLLAKDSMKTLQELADEAFSDLLRKHGRPATLKEALRASVRRLPANDPGQGKGRRS